jgi:hypothetical protein
VEVGEGGGETMQSGMNLKQKGIVVIMDVMLLAQLTFSIYLAQQDPNTMVVVFLRTFIPLVIGTLVLGRLFLRRCRTREHLALEAHNPKTMS